MNAPAAINPGAAVERTRNGEFAALAGCISAVEIQDPPSQQNAFWSGGTLPPVLDVCCGSRMMWLDKADARAMFADKRRETWAADLGTESTKGRTPIVVKPDVLADFTELPFPADSFAHVVFDPPHIVQLEETAGLLTKKYGSLVGDWREMLRGGFSECFRVLKPGGTLIFKWNAVNVPLREILALTPEKPLYGHRSGKKATTHWVAFLKPPAPAFEECVSGLPKGEAVATEGRKYNAADQQLDSTTRAPESKL